MRWVRYSERTVGTVDREAADAFRILSKEINGLTNLMQDKVGTLSRDVSDIKTDVAVIKTEMKVNCKDIEENKTALNNHKKEHAINAGKSIDRWTALAIGCLSAVISTITTIIGMVIGGG